MNTVQVTISAKEREQELLISQLEEWEVIGFEQTEECLIAYFPEGDFRSQEIGECLEAYPFTVQTLPDKNWNEVWEGNFQPVIVPDFCVIRAHFHPPMQHLPFELIITPKMSFGTGHHATTYLMVEQMKDLSFTGKTVFDFGTGTGILAILAEKLGASKIHATDVDPWSIDNARENLEKNRAEQITLEKSSMVPQGKYDVILANINRNVLVENLSALKNVLAEDGLLLLSGLLSSDADRMIQLCKESGLCLFRHTQKDNWISLLFTHCPGEMA
ncbi:MAG: 50S ribosomal protein L11 methyltransferase [Flavisolibacter sp.]